MLLSIYKLNKMESLKCVATSLLTFVLVHPSMKMNHIRLFE